jgi:G3E family GTPase
VTSGKHIVHVLATINGSVALKSIHHLGKAIEKLDAWLGEFDAHGNRQQTADNASDNREYQVKCADILVIGRIDPPRPA